jgi:multiple sugar transport system permease protein
MAVFGARRGIREGGWGYSLFAAIISLIYFFPVLWIILTAFKTHNDALAIPPKFLFTPTLENFVSVFSRAYIKGQAAVDTGSTCSSSIPSSSPAPA